MAGSDYLRYADGDASRLFDFTSQYSFADREIWRRIDATLMRLAASGRRTLSLLDAGCGPGTWLRRTALRARELGFERINAFGFDISPTMVALAKSSLAGLDDLTVRMHFLVRDITAGPAFTDQEFDLCLCLYGVLNHLPVTAHDQVAQELVDRRKAERRQEAAVALVDPDDAAAAVDQEHPLADAREQVEHRARGECEDALGIERQCRRSGGGGRHGGIVARRFRPMAPGTRRIPTKRPLPPCYAAALQGSSAHDGAQAFDPFA